MMIHRCPSLSKFPAIKHGFFEDDPEILLSHRNQAMKIMTGYSPPLIILKQVHGTKVLEITDLYEGEKEGDGMVTRTKGIALGILTADCGPLLFYDPEAHVIGACHAGWRGAKAGIIQETIAAMEGLGAARSNIHGTLGPTIQQENYEVGPEFPDLFGEPYETYFYPSERKNHHYFNLPHYIYQQLLKEELRGIYDIRRDTFTGNFSSRRRFLSEGQQKIASNNLSAIAIS